MTQDEAINRAVNLNKDRVNVFCPIIKDTCKTNCDWYDKARPHRPLEFIDPNKWTVLGGYCEPKLNKECEC